MRESQTPVQKLQSRYLWNGSVLAVLAALVLARAWVRCPYVMMCRLPSAWKRCWAARVVHVQSGEREAPQPLRFLNWRQAVAP